MKLPTLTRTLLWFFIFAGAWNGLLGLVFLFEPSQGNSLSSEPGMKIFMTLGLIGGWYFLLFSILAIKGKEIGIKGIQLGLIYVACCSVAWIVFNIISIASGNLIFALFASIPGIITISGILVLLWRHFTSKRITEIYKA